MLPDTSGLELLPGDMIHCAVLYHSAKDGKNIWVALALRRLAYDVPEQAQEKVRRHWPLFGRHRNQEEEQEEPELTLFADEINNYERIKQLSAAAALEAGETDKYLDNLRPVYSGGVSWTKVPRHFTESALSQLRHHCHLLPK